MPIIRAEEASTAPSRLFAASTPPMEPDEELDEDELDDEEFDELDEDELDDEDEEEEEIEDWDDEDE